MDKLIVQGRTAVVLSHHETSAWSTSTCARNSAKLAMDMVLAEQVLCKNWSGARERALEIDPDMDTTAIEYLVVELVPSGALFRVVRQLGYSSGWECIERFDIGEWYTA
jgi:hypothetical protein